MVLLVGDDVDIVLILVHDLRLDTLVILLLVFKVADHGFLSVAWHRDRFDLVHVLWRFEIPEHLLLLIGEVWLVLLLILALEREMRASV